MSHKYSLNHFHENRGLLVVPTIIYFDKIDNNFTFVHSMISFTSRDTIKLLCYYLIKEFNCHVD